MTPRLTYKNITIVGLVQVGAVVAGVLGAGSAFRMWAITGLPQFSHVEFATEYGFLLLAVPLVWITVAMIVQGRSEASDTPEILTFCSGVFVLAGLTIWAFRVGLAPWGKICGMSFDS